MSKFDEEKKSWLDKFLKRRILFVLARILDNVVQGPNQTQYT